MGLHNGDPTISGSGFVADPTDPKKQVGWTGPQPNASFIAIMTQAERLATKAAKGTMVYQSDLGGGIFIYDGTAWTSAIT